jgi:low temperature requirement protein LtrA
MVARDPSEPHRVSTPLELLFDLCFVVAIAQAAAHLHHALGEAHALHGLLGFASAFFAIWWAWMNLTWFASAFDVDDVPYRLLVLMQISGVLVLAAGVPRAFEDGDFGVITAGFTIMRVSLIALWLRAGHVEPARRRTARRSALGLALCQVGWLSMLSWPAPARAYGFLLFALCELAVPLWAERAGKTSWHPHHIAERYGLLMLIVLGESVLSATEAVQSALESSASSWRLLSLGAGGLLIVFSMWWIYFEHPAQRVLHSTRMAFIWGYGHFPIFASIAATGAGLALVADHAAGHAHISRAATGAAVAIPVATYLVSVWFAHVRPHMPGRAPALAFLLTTCGVLLAPALSGGVLLIGALLAALVTFLVIRQQRA